MAAKLTNEELQLVANTIRGLSMDGVQKANSGHPGMPLGMADVASVLLLQHLEHCPTDPDWINRDRFMLSAGHGSMLLYSMLHLSGYDLPLDELKAFRQMDSKTPGHPEWRHTVGVETTTGPLGQGIANAVGMALAEQMLAARFNDGDYQPVDHNTYVICGDGCLMEGISHEACSLAGHLGLSKLVLIYDSNRITIEGSTDLAYSDDVKKRFQGYNWRVLEIDAHDYTAIDKALRKAKREQERPTIIIATSNIGKGSPNKEDTSSAHGEPLGEEEVALTRQNLGLPPELFHVSGAVRDLFEKRLKTLKRRRNKWKRELKAQLAAKPEFAKRWQMFFENRVPDNLMDYMPEFPVDTPVATRAAGGKVIQAVAGVVPQLVGGSADLAPSTKTLISGTESVAPGAFGGRNLHFGVREHAMAGMMNGMALHGGLRVFGATFFVFVDYCRPSVRLAALMGLPVIYVFTHDSFYVGEDGPTHEPVEHIASLRCMPNMTTIRPADATETAAAWVAAMQNTTGPTAILLTRQNLPIIDRAVYPAADSVLKGAYTLWQTSTEIMPQVVLLASGSEVSLAMDAARTLASECCVRVVSMPSWELFEKQSDAYKADTIPADVPVKVAIEAGSPMGWEKYIGAAGRTVSMQGFGASAPYKVLEKQFGFTVSNVVRTVREML